MQQKIPFKCNFFWNTGKLSVKRGERMAHCKPSAYAARFWTLLAFSLYPSSRAHVYSCWRVTDFKLYPLFKDLQAPNKIHYPLIYGIYEEHFAHHCNSATSGMKDRILGEEHILPEGSKRKVLNNKFLIKLRGEFSQELINYSSKILSG